MEDGLRPKLGGYGDECLSPVSYPDVWAIEQTSGPQRLRIGPSRNFVEVLCALAKTWNDDCRLLYVLLVPRLGEREPGRYQAEHSFSITQVEEFCKRFKPFLEGDGRHHLWIGSVNNVGLLVYDRHQWIYAYGDIPSYIAALEPLGFVEGAIELPSPHSHNYNASFDVEENALMEWFSWMHSPLQPDDES